MSQIAILGFGVVGSGVAEVLKNNAASISERAWQPVELKYILDVRDFTGHPDARLFVQDFDAIVSDPEIDVIVETIGGTGAALAFTRRALEAGKSVVTSNKAAVAEHGVELQRLARDRGVNYLFEASVGGGIPIIRPIRQCLTANRLTSVCGILNGTTNYMLTRMSADGLSYGQALAEAQEKGYAERDPSDDVDGHDTARKLAILSTLAFGQVIRPSDIPTTGIRTVTAADFSAAQVSGHSIKLLGRADHSGGKTFARVAPEWVPSNSALFPVGGVFNAITVEGDAIGEVMFYGQGAGKLPTASAVIADIIDALRHKDNRRFLGILPVDG
jgi:homoserine dehydrogenase